MTVDILSKKRKQAFGHPWNSFYPNNRMLRASAGEKIKTLSDDDLMPFGMHQGKPMKDVPHDYLQFIWKKGLCRNFQCPVADYVRRNGIAE